MSRTLTACSILLCSAAALSVARGQAPASDDSAAAAGSEARGVVFQDTNENGVRDEGEQGLVGVRVSNGREIVTSDSEGRYQLPVTDDTILFVLKPRGWRAPVNALQLPRFYYIHKPHGSPAFRYPGVAPTGPLPDSIDFALCAQSEPDSFRVILFGDPQPRDEKEVEYIGRDVVQELVGTKAAFGVTLGDIMFDDLSLFESEAETIAVLGKPWYNVIGNHDSNYDAAHDRLSNESFERVYGPSYYSFDYGPVHFVVLDDIEWSIDASTQKGSYRGGLGEEQIAYVRNDLAGVPNEQLVVLLMHIPIMGVHDREDLFRIIEQRPHCISVSGHTHTHEHHFLTSDAGWRGPRPHHHIVHNTVCGSWWRGMPDERGIPHTTLKDGGPNGYGIMSFDGHEYVLDYKAAARPADYQLEIYAPDRVTQSQLADTQVLVNVFNGSERSQVRMRLAEQGEWLPLHHAPAVDPAYQAAYDRDIELENNPWIDLPKPAVSTHIWSAQLPADLPPGKHLIRVHTTDMHGREFSASRVIRVVPEAAVAGEESPSAVQSK